jgi:hypothetical protein
MVQQGDKIATFQTGDGRVVPLSAIATVSQNDKFTTIHTHDGRAVAVKVISTIQQGDEFIVLQTGDGRVVPVKFGILPGDFMVGTTWKHSINSHSAVVLENFDEALNEMVAYYGPVAGKSTGAPSLNAAINGIAQFKTNEVWMWGTYLHGFTSELLYPDRDAVYTENGWTSYEVPSETEWGMDPDSIHQIGVCILWDGVYYDPDDPTAWKDHLLMDWYSLGFPGGESEAVWEYRPGSQMNERGPYAPNKLTLDCDPNSGEVFLTANIWLRQKDHTSYYHSYSVVLKRNGLRSWEYYKLFQTNTWTDGDPAVSTEKPYSAFQVAMVVWRGKPVYVIQSHDVSPAEFYLYNGVDRVHTFSDAFPDYPDISIKTEDGVLLWNAYSRKIWWYEGGSVYEYPSPTGDEGLFNKHSYFVDDPYTAGSPIYFAKQLDLEIVDGAYLYVTEIYQWNITDPDPANYTWDLVKTSMEYPFEWNGKWSQTRDKLDARGFFGTANPYGWNIGGWMYYTHSGTVSTYNPTRTGRDDMAWSAIDYKYTNYKMGLVTWDGDLAAADRVLKLTEFPFSATGFVSYEYSDEYTTLPVQFNTGDAYVKGGVAGVNCDSNGDVWLRVTSDVPGTYDLVMYGNEADWEASTNQVAHVSYTTASTRYNMTEDNDSGIDARVYIRDLFTMDKMVATITLENDWVLYPRSSSPSYNETYSRTGFTNGFLANPIDFLVANTIFSRPEFEE